VAVGLPVDWTEGWTADRLWTGPGDGLLTSGKIGLTILAFKILVTRLKSVIKTSQLMLYREIMAFCSEIHTKHINTVCGQNVELLNVKLTAHIVTTGLQRVKCLL